MKISASHRSPRATRTRPLHRQLALRRAWQQRLFSGSALALVGSLLGWLLGLPAVWQLGAACLGLLIGLAWRFQHTSRHSEHWAFGWIEERSGLSYQTATELGDDDAGGLAEAVRARAAKTSSLDLPSLQPWFLPLLVVALMVMALPHLAVPGLRAPLAGLGAPLRALQPQPSPEPVGEVGNEMTAPATDATDVSLTEAGDAAPNARAPNAQDPGAASDPDAQRSFDTGGRAEQSDAASGEEAALEQFLSQQTPERTTAAGASSAQQGEGGEGSGEAGAASEAGTTNDEDAERAQSGERGSQEEASGAGQQQEAQAQPREGEQPDASERAQAGESNGQANGDTQRTSTASGEDKQTAETMQDKGQARGSETRYESTVSGDATTIQQSAGAKEAGDVNQTIRGGKASERAGTGPGEDIESSRARLGGNTNAAERLSGERGEGPSSLVQGESLEQGQAPAALPQTGTPQSYQRAAEEVIREGRIPLEYQTIVRDYFR